MTDKEKIEELRKFIDLQAKDEGLWFVAEMAPEARVQRGLRGCHAMFEQLFPTDQTRQEPPEIFEGTRAALDHLTVKPHEHEWIRGAIQYHCKCGAILSEAGSRERDAADSRQNESIDHMAGRMTAGILRARDDQKSVGEGQTVAEKYQELIYQVETKHPGESRHETAKRYIHERENRPRPAASND